MNRVNSLSCEQNLDIYPALILFFPPPNLLFPVSAGNRNSAPVRGPKEPKYPENARPQNLKARLQKAGPKTFFVPCFSVSARDPNSAGSQRAQVPRKVRPQNLKIEAPKSGAPNGFLFPVSARDPNSAGPHFKESKAPKSEAPK